MAKFRKGAAAIQAAVASKSGGWKPVLRWSKAGETRYVQFLEPLDEVSTVLMHRAMIVGYYEDGKEMYRDFVSRLDPGIDGPQGYDPIAERGWQPKEVNVFRVVELDPVYGKGKGGRKTIEGFDIVYRTFENEDGEDVEVPNIAFIQESPHTFGNFLATHDQTDPVEDAIWKVTQSGEKKDKKFDFERVPNVEPLDLSEFEEDIEQLGDVDAYLEELASEDRLAEYVDDKPEDWEFSPWGGPKKKKGGGKSSAGTQRSSRSRRTRDEEPEEEPESDPEPEAEPEEDDKPRGRSRAARAAAGGERKRRSFDHLKRKATT